MNDPTVEADPSTGIDTSADFIKLVEEEGGKVVIAAKDELQIDLDTEEDYKRWLRSSEIFFRYVDITKVMVTPSYSGLPHRHITIKLPFKVGRWQRLALQAALGSDPIRELLSSIRYMEGDKYPTLFRENKEIENE